MLETLLSNTAFKIAKKQLKKKTCNSKTLLEISILTDRA